MSLTNENRYEPRTVGERNLPTDCCEFGVVDLNEGVEVCRVWREGYARKIARLLNADAVTEADYEARLMDALASDPKEDQSATNEPKRISV